LTDRQFFFFHNPGPVQPAQGGPLQAVPPSSTRKEVLPMTRFTDADQALIGVWEAHTAAEFEHKDADAAIAMMTERPALVHVPVGTGATGKEALRKFYSEVFIPQMPEDVSLQLLSRSVGQDRVVDEFILHLTHSVRMDWFLPGVEPTGRRLAVPHVGIIAFENGKISSEHIYWDQATVLFQLGMLERSLPVMGANQKDRLLDSDAPANQLIDRFSRS
jgi:carboxymethylenebutenolidase